MSSNTSAEAYKQAHDLVIEQYKSNPEDAALLRFIEEHRTGKRTHNSVWNEFMNRIEKALGEILANQSVPVTVQPTKPPVKVKVEYVNSDPDGEFNGLGLN